LPAAAANPPNEAKRELGEPDQYVAVVPQTERGYHPSAAYTCCDSADRAPAGDRTLEDDGSPVGSPVQWSQLTISAVRRSHQLLANVNTPADGKLEALHNHEL
jgi:hypothetical protein